MVKIIMFCLCIIYAHNAYALNTRDTAASKPAIISHNTLNNYHLYYSTKSPITPYLSAQDTSNDNSLDTFWNTHKHYQSPVPAEPGNAWAGVRVKLSALLNLDLDTDLRNIRSSFSLTPKTKMRFKVRSREIKAEFRYQY